MKKCYSLKMLLTFLILFVATSGIQAQQTVTISDNTGNYNYRAPMNGSYNYGWSAMIYDASEIGNAYRIQSLAFKVHQYNTSSATYANQKIYMAEVSNSTFASTNYISPSSVNAVKVYEGSLTYNTSGYKNITLQQEFYYTGTGNLLILYENRSNYGVYYEPQFEYSTRLNKTIYDYTSSSTIYSGHTTSYRPDIQLGVASASSNDLSLTQWVFPTQGASGSPATPVIIKVKNTGSAAQNNFSLKYSIDNGNNWVTENYSGTLNSNSEITYSFSTLADLSSAGVYNMIAAVSNTGDTLNYNDTIRQDVLICSGALSGTYTVGNSATDDFSSISDAINLIGSCTVSGPITINIKPGTYNEQLRIPAITGASATNTITLQSSTGNASDVIISASPSSSKNYVVSLDTTSYIKLKDLTLSPAGGAYTTSVRIKNSNSVTVEGCYMQSVNNPANTSNNHSPISIQATASGKGHNITLKNNTIKYGNYAIYGDGSTSSHIENLTISNNTLIDQKQEAIRINRGDSVIIKGNEISGSIEIATAIYLNQCNNFMDITGNQIAVSNGNGIYLNNCSGSSSEPIWLNNNFISVTNITNYNKRGIHIYNSSFVNVDFNSLNLLGSSNAIGIDFYNAAYCNLRNNLVINQTQGVAVDAQYGSGIITGDYNNFYTAGSTLAYWNGSSSTISQLKTNSGKNQNSISSFVTFYSDVDLHTNNSTVNNMGTPIAGITTDFDGQTRSTSTPDIGADEFRILQYDAGLISFNNIGNLCPGQSTPLKVELKNMGYGTLTSAIINWKVNDTLQTAKTWNGILPVGTKLNVTLGNKSLQMGQSYDFEAWITKVNGVADSNSYNDTIRANNITPAVGSGTYTIGSSSTADYPTIEAAITQLNNNGVCGAVVFELESGTYNRQIDFGNIPNASNSNTITFKSQSGNASDVIIEYEPTSSSSDYVLHFSGASHIAFQDLTIKNKSSNYLQAVLIENNSSHLEFDNVIFESVKSSSFSNYDVLFEVNYCSDITVKNSTFPPAYTTLNIYGSYNNKLQNIKLINNTIINPYRFGINVTYADSVIVDGNIITSSTPTYNMANFIRMVDCYTNIKVVNNIIKIHGSNSAVGIYFNDLFAGSSANSGLIANNYILQSLNNQVSYYGIEINDGNYLNIYHNTVKLNSTSSNSRGLYCRYSDDVYAKNNIFDVNKGYAVDIYKYYSDDVYMDYNNLVSNEYIGEYNNNNYSDIASWKTAAGAPNSMSYTPSYVNPADYHLYDLNLNNAGTPLTEVSTDIEGDARSSSTPDIGADEFNVNNFDVAITAITSPSDTTGTGSRDVKVKIRNWGQIQLATATINWQLNGTAQTAYSWSGSLPSLSESGELNIGSANISSGTNTIKAWVSSPNGNTDQNNANDTLTKQVHGMLIPVMDVTPNPVDTSVTVCNDSLTLPLTIKNTGQSALSYEFQTISSPYDSISTLYYNSTGAFTTHTFTNINQSTDTLKLIITVNGDFNGYSEYIDIYLDGVLYATWDPGDHQIDITKTFNIAGSSLAGYLSDQTITVKLQNSSQVNTGYGTMMHKIQALADGLSWASVAGADSATVATGDSSIVNLTLSSLGLTNGTYSTNLKVNTNIPGNNVINIPVNFLVNGTAQLTFSDTVLSFASTHIGVTSHDSVTVSNSGCSNLTISNVTFSDTVFKTTQFIDTITPGNSRKFGFTYTPQSAGTDTATAYFHTNTGIIQLPVTAVSTTPPTLTVTPDTIDVTINNCGDSTIVNLKLENSGSGTLNVSMKPSDSLKILMLTYGNYSSTYKNNFISAMGYDFSEYTIEEFNSSSAALTQTKINALNPDVIAIPYLNTNYSTSNYIASISSALQNYVSSGGTLLMAGQSNSTALNNTGIFTTTYSSYDGNRTLTVVDQTDSITQGLGSGFYTYDYFHYHNFNHANLKPLINYYSYNVTASVSIGTGEAIYLGFRYYNTSNNNYPKIVASNVLKNIHSDEADWIDYSTANYNISSGNFVNQPVTLSSAGLSTGSYFSNIYITTNNPANPITVLPCSLTVLNQLPNPVDLGPDTNYCGPVILDAGSGYSSYQWSNNATSQMITASSTGNYSVTVSNGANCASSDTVFIAIFPEPNPVITSSPASMCDYESAVTLSASPAGGTFTGTGISGNSFDPQTAGTGTHTITYTYTNGFGCTNTTTTDITVYPQPVVGFSGLATNYCPAEPPVQLTGNPAGGVFTGPGITGNTFTPALAGGGTHQIYYKYTNANGCSDSVMQQTVVATPVSIAITGLNPSYCEYDAAVNLSASPAGGTFTGPGVTGSVFDPAQAGAGVHYVVYEFQNSGCTDKDSLQVTVHAKPAVQITNLSSQYCLMSNPVALNATPAGGTFIGPGMNGGTFDPQAAGSGIHQITYSYTDPNGCSNIDTATVAVTAPQPVVFSSPTTYCMVNDTFPLSASPAGGTFTGTGVVMNSFIPTQALLGANNIIYTATDNNGCLTSDTIIITVHMPTSSSFTGLNTSYCSNESSASLTGSPMGGVFSGPGISGSVFDPASAGTGLHTITYTYTNSYGCISSSNQQVEVLQAPVANAGTDTSVIQGNSVQLNGSASMGSGNYTWSWSPAAKLSNPAIPNPVTVNLSNSTTYNLLVTDNNTSCSATDDVTVTVTGGPLSVNINASNTIICQGDSINLSVVPSGGTGNYTYTWTSDPAGFTSTQQSIKVAPDSTTIYIGQVDDGTATGTATASQQIIVHQVPHLSIGNLDTAYCSNATAVNLQPAPAGGNLSGNGLSGLTFNPASVGASNTVITYEYTTAQGCYTSISKNVAIYDAPVVFAGRDTILPCANNGLYLGQQPESGIMYSWSPDINLSSNSVANPFATPNLTMTYTLTATNPGSGCSSSDQVKITISDGPTANAWGDTVICIGDSAVLGASGGTSYLWNNNMTGSTVKVSPATSTNYVVIATTSGCSDVDTVEVLVNDPQPVLGIDTTICVYNTITLDPGVFSFYNWSTGESTPDIVVDSTGTGVGVTTVWVMVEDSLGCQGSDTIMITFDDCFGITDFTEEIRIKVFPNPTSGIVNLESHYLPFSRFNMAVFSAEGKLISNREIHTQSQKLSHSFDMSQLPKGVYLIRLYNEDFSKTVRVVVE